MGIWLDKVDSEKNKVGGIFDYSLLITGKSPLPKAGVEPNI